MQYVAVCTCEVGLRIADKHEQEEEEKRRRRGGQQHNCNLRHMFHKGFERREEVYIINATSLEQ